MFKTFLKITVVAFLIYFFSWFAVYKTGINKLSIQSEDTLPAMFLPVTLIKEGTFYVDTYYEMLIKAYPNPDDKSYTKGLIPFYLRKVTAWEPSSNVNVAAMVPRAHYISAFPVITGLLALPVYAIPLALGMSITWPNLTILAHITAALIVAFSGGFLYLLLKKHFSLDEKKSLLLTAIYLFGTINFALISQSMWQHGTLQLFLILGLYFLFNGLSAEATDKDSSLFWSGLFMALAVISRPTAGLAAVLLYALIYLKYKTNFKALINHTFFYGLGVLPVLAFFIWYNQTFYLNISNQGYSNQLGTNWLSPFPEGFLGTWISPSKGILIYSPVFLFSLVGLFLVVKNKLWRQNAHYFIFALIVLLHTLVMGFWKHWFGGWSFGYRMSSDIIPFLILLAVPYLQSNIYERTKKWFYALIAFSVGVQIFGIIFFDGVWHSAYDLGYKNTSWLWSIKDSEFVFNIRRILVKLHVISQACPKCLPES